MNEGANEASNSDSSDDNKSSDSQNSSSFESSDTDERLRGIKTSRNEFLNKYDVLREKIKSGNTEAQKGEGSKLALNLLVELNDIYDLVQTEKNRDTRVQLKDAEALHDSSRFAAVNAKNLKFGDVGISLNQNDFIKNVKAYMNENEGADGNFGDGDDDMDADGQADVFNSYNWLKLGGLYHSHSKRAIPTDFLYGPLATERKRTGPRQRNIDDTGNGPSATAKLIQASEISTNDEQNTSSMVRGVYQAFTQRKGEGSINFFSFFINPHSFSQSVENLFFTSFLIRDGKFKLYKDETGIPMLQKTSPREAEDARSSKDKTHHIAVFDYVTWEGLIKTFNIKEPFLDHREGEEDHFPSDDEMEESDENGSEDFEEEDIAAKSEEENDAIKSEDKSEGED